MRRSHEVATGTGTVRCTWESERASCSRMAAARSRARGMRLRLPSPRLDQHALEPLAAGDEPAALDIELEDVVDRPDVADAHLRSRHEPGFLPARHAALVHVANLSHRGGGAASQRGERHERPPAHAAARIRDWMAVRIL